MSVDDDSVFGMAPEVFDGRASPNEDHALDEGGQEQKESKPLVRGKFFKIPPIRLMREESDPA